MKMKTTKLKFLMITLGLGIITHLQTFAQISGSGTGVQQEIYIINTDQSINDAALKLRTYQGSGTSYSDWLMYSNRNNYDLSFRHVRTNLPGNSDTFLPPGAAPLLIKENGNIGLGTTIDPAEKLHIEDGNLRFHMMNGAGGKSQKIEWYENASGNDKVQLSYFGQNLNGGGRGMDRLIFSNGDWLNSEINDAANMNQEHTNVMMTMRPSNKAVGIGTLNPKWRLDVTGAVNATEYRLNGAVVNFSGGTNPWTLSGSNINYSSGNVGIGNTNPVHKLDVNGAVNATEFRLNGQLVNFNNSPWTLNGSSLNYTAGKVGIGIANPERALHVRSRDGILRVDRDVNSVGLMLSKYEDGFTSVNKTFFLGVDGQGANQGEFFIGDLAQQVTGSGNKRLVLQNDGNVQIVKSLSVGSPIIVPGTVAHFDGRVYISEVGGTQKGFVSQTSTNFQDYLLWVEEGIVSKDFAIANTTNWPDYVFTKEYKLPSLSTIEQSIKENGHLPTMPSAKEIEENGFTVNDMTKRMVKTIEELTLHTISQEKQINTQNDLIRNLMTRLEALEAGK